LPETQQTAVTFQTVRPGLRGVSSKSPWASIRPAGAAQLTEPLVIDTPGMAISVFMNALGAAWW
jgi:hypothetical protein